MDSRGHILVTSMIKRNSFIIYNYTKDINIGVNALHFFNILKPLKKKDILKLRVTDNNKLDITYIPKDGGREVSSSLPVFTAQNIEFIPPSEFPHQPIVIFSDQFQKMCKEMSSLCKDIKVYSNKYAIKFETESLYKVTQIFSSYDESDMKYEGINKHECNNFNYMGMFSSSSITKFTKISKFSSLVRFYIQKNSPLKISTNLGESGYMEVYIKSNELISEEDDNSNRDDEQMYSHLL
jgi:hypothetical protein